jgi:hypothetical protein
MDATEAGRGEARWTAGAIKQQRQSIERKNRVGMGDARKYGGINKRTTQQKEETGCRMQNKLQNGVHVRSLGFL